jgi:hypothetical protein
MLFSLKSEAKRYQIALLAGALSAFAADLPRLEAAHRGCETACGAEATCGCDQPVCSCQTAPVPACGVEAGCAAGPNCGCGAEVACGAEAGCGVEMGYGEVACGAEAPCGCDACGQTKKKTNCLTKAMGSIKGSFNKLKAKMSPKKSSCDVLCDDGCDAMMQGELMMPVPYETYGTVMPAPMPSASGPTGMALPHASTTLIPAPAAPHDHHDQRMGSGVIVPAPHASGSSGSSSQSRMNIGQPSLVPTPVIDPQPRTAPQHRDSIHHEPTETDKLFDSVGDPFVDEQASTGRKQGPSVSRRMPPANSAGLRSR